MNDDSIELPRNRLAGSGRGYYRMSVCLNCGKKLNAFTEQYGLLGTSSEHLCEQCRNKMIKLLEGKVITEDLAERYSSVFLTNGITQNGLKHIHEYALVKTGVKAAEEQRIEQERIQEQQRKEQEKVSFAQSFNEYYEYDVVTVINVDHGQVDKEKMMEILSSHARNGWRLHSVYSNELGKNAIRILGFGVNATACEDVLIFERRIQSSENNQ